MAQTKIKKYQLEFGTNDNILGITNADIAGNAAIITTKLAEGADFIKRTGTVAFTADQSMGGFRLTNVGTPIQGTDAARLIDIQNNQAGLSGKPSVRVATTANITLSGTQTIDGIAVVVGDRVLVKNQTIESENGIYVVAAGAWTRSTDTDTGTELDGAYVFVTEGTVNGNSGWLQSTDLPITVGSTDIEWIQFSGGGQIIAGAGLTKTGNQIDIVTASTARIVINNNDIDLAPVTVSGSGVGVGSVDGYGRITSIRDLLTSDMPSGTVNISNRITREQPSGSVNGINVTFTLAYTPLSGTEEVFVNGVLQDSGLGNDYTISGATITMLTTPLTSDKIRVSYFK